MRVGVVGRQALGLRRGQKFLIGGKQHRGRKVVSEKCLLQKERAGQVDCIVATQLLAAGQLDSPENEILIHIQSLPVSFTYRLTSALLSA